MICHLQGWIKNISKGMHVILDDTLFFFLKTAQCDYLGSLFSFFLNKGRFCNVLNLILDPPLDYPFQASRSFPNQYPSYILF